MLSSLIFAALAAAWLVVLVPMFARRRQEVSKTTDSALAARVVRRGSGRRPAASAAQRTYGVEEAYGMPDTGQDDVDVDEYQDDGGWRRVHSDDVRAGRRYRPGRGGFDPEAAALAAKAKYARRQRIVLVILLTAVGTALVAALAWPMLWWLHGAVDLALVGYLAYLRRQVRIEEDVRSRRLARISGAREADEDGEYVEYEDGEYDQVDDYDDVPEREEPEEVDDRPRRRAAATSTHTGAVAVEIDDEDPMFDELDERTWEPYRRAVGE
ncbi:hypothetical protein A8924_1175 [Saccharopolyspora erythraea NRRL 2338]|uniref:Uncharacterized protein n=2 Tax=Saccharopolyspora erythraea TaxID=1836 RepID=A4F7U4_SACEN|nr:gephyrin-like molybdotransferase receptor GlpR [Saccharopolyspora erythraea]EQD83809.1 hypothetical protein N599_23165 [Saccharopolyspora erythraea D]PFG93917.1 hypothetical protein A8924_1175 [Saccharopolyspora erythraea NRRL 2338]QRK90744.1 hypothetical protein JQX30_04410 [Saccharopolyspora erythraea]CAM00118.1 hypothetical protein SACE_0777 [Saccharopolyspora erythraea NRRL 2338]